MNRIMTGGTRMLALAGGLALAGCFGGDEAGDAPKSDKAAKADTKADAGKAKAAASKPIEPVQDCIEGEATDTLIMAGSPRRAAVPSPARPPPHLAERPRGGRPASSRMATPTSSTRPS